MSNLETKQNVPLTEGEDGTIRVTGSRVTLNSIIHNFKLGATAEQIQHSFPSLSLRDIYGAIFYYLENTVLVEEYLSRQEQAAQQSRRFIDEHFDTTALRERILARRSRSLQN